MSGTALSRQRVCCKILCNRRTAADSQKPGSRTDGFPFYRRRNFKLFVFQSFVYSVHDPFPQLVTPARIRTAHRLVVVVTSPYGSGIVRCVSCKPEIHIVSCRTGFSCCSHIVQPCSSSGSLINNIFHSACEKIGCRVFYYLLSFRRSVIDQDIAVVIQNLCIESRFCINSSVCQRCKCCCKFDIIYTQIQTAESLGLRISVFFIQGCKAEIQKEVITFFFTNVFC